MSSDSTIWAHRVHAIGGEHQGGALLELLPQRLERQRIGGMARHRPRADARPSGRPSCARSCGSTCGARDRSGSPDPPPPGSAPSGVAGPDPAPRSSWKVAMPTRPSISAAAAENSAENFASRPVRGREWIRMRGTPAATPTVTSSTSSARMPSTRRQLERAVDDRVRARAGRVGLHRDPGGQDLPRRGERPERLEIAACPRPAR